MFEEIPATQQPDAEITEYVKREKNIPSSTRAKNLKYRVVYDFVTLLFVYNEIVPEGVAKRQRHKEIQELVNVRMEKHREIMTGNMIGFVIWAIVGVIIIGLGVRAYLSKKAVGFWANIRPISVNDVTGYNRAVGKLFVIYGVIFIALGLPLVSGQNSSFILLSVLGAMIETIVIMAIYSLCIERKYKEQ